MQRLGTAEPAYWVRPGLDVRERRLHVAGRDTTLLADELSLPHYVVDLERIGEQARALQQAMARAGLRGLVRLALKAQREPEALRFVRALGPPGSPGAVGVDACSPGEVHAALEQGWLPEEISYTGTNLSDEDLDELLPHPIHINVDLLTQLEKLGRRAPGRRVGIRVNPRAGAAWGDGRSLYSGERPTKFGIYEEQLTEAVAITARYGLEISTVHYHIADGVLTDGLGRLEQAARTVAMMVGRLRDLGCPIAEVNTGGGLGVPLRDGDRPLDLEAWAAMLAHHLGPLEVTVATEPGNFLVKESAILLAKVVTVERRLGARFVGLNVGWNVMSYRFLYGRPFEVVLCRDPLAEVQDAVTISGNINEGDDLFAEDYPFPAVVEGDVVALLAVGGYNQAMQSSHCLRPPADSTFFSERL
jgi:diaminopimelate decarboxylase